MAVILLLALAGCQYDPFTAIYTRKQPKVEDLIGVYVPDEDTEKAIHQQGHYPPADTSIILGPNELITINNLPDWWRNFAVVSHGGFESGSGKWDIEKQQERWVVGVLLTSASQSSPSPHPSGGFATDLCLTGEKPPYRIHLILGDQTKDEEWIL